MKRYLALALLPLAILLSGSGVYNPPAAPGATTCAGLSDGGTACTKNTGTSGATVPLLNGANTWSAVQTLSNGAVGAPSVNLGDATSGFYRSAADIISVALGGTLRYGFAGSGVSVFAPQILIRSSQGFIGLSSDGNIGFGSGSNDNTGGNDAAIKRGAAKVVELSDGDTAGGTFRAIATTPAQITSNQDNYNPGGSSYFQRWSSDAARNVTGMTFTAAQVDGQAHLICDVGTQTITLKEQVTSTATNQFMNSTAADIVLSGKQCADAIYDGTTARWRVFKRN